MNRLARPSLARPPLTALLACTLLACTLLAALACTSGAPRRVTPYDEALRQVHLRGGKLAWDGLEVGMTRRQVERALGQRLPAADGPDELCADYYVAAEAHGQRLGLVFRGPTEGARLRAIGVLLPGGFDMEAVVAGLRARLPEMRWVPSRHQPEAAEHELRNRLYEVAEAGVVFVNPDGGFQIGDVCVD